VAVHPGKQQYSNQTKRRVCIKERGCHAELKMTGWCFGLPRVLTKIDRISVLVCARVNGSLGRHLAKLTKQLLGL